MKRLGIVLATIVIAAFSVSAPIIYVREASALGPAQYSGDIKYHRLDHPKYMRTWKMTGLYDLRTNQKIGNYGVGKNIEVTHLAYKKGMFFYLTKDSLSQGRMRGVIINTVFQVTKDGRAVYGGKIVPMRNGMPLTQHLTEGGPCTARRLWYQGMNNEMVKRIQKVELHMGRHLPIKSAYRTYNEQVCLWNGRGSNGLPVAYPGTSDHNKGLAIDVVMPYHQLYKTYLNQYGLYQTVAGDPPHYTLPK